MIDRKSLEIRTRKGLRQLKLWQYDKESITPNDIGCAGTTPVPCSCFMCGNWRTKLKGEHCLTVQERKALEADRYVLNGEEERFDESPAAWPPSHSPRPEM